jgi:hypothetical protein
MVSQWVLYYNGGETPGRIASGSGEDLFVADEAGLTRFLRIVGRQGV